MIAGGVTVIFVSHDTFAVKNLCRRAFLMQSGEILMDGTAKEVIEAYRNMQIDARRDAEQSTLPADFFGEVSRKSVEQSDSTAAENLMRDKEIFDKRAEYQRTGNRRAEFINVQLLDSDGKILTEAIFEQTVVLRMVIRFNDDIDCVGFGYHIRNATGIDLVYTDSRFDGMKVIFGGRRGEIYVVDWRFKVSLRQEAYDVACVISIPVEPTMTYPDVCDSVPCALQFSVVSPNPAMNLTGGYVHWQNEMTITKFNGDIDK